jgi:small subunit ribosomal protein S6
MNASRQYELVYITSPDATEQQLADLHGQIEAIVSRFGGRIDNTENWGRRKLAYEIGRQKEGVYVLELITGPGEMVRELDRRLKVLDAILRHLVVRVDEELKVAEQTRTHRREHSERRRIARGLPPQVEPAPGRTSEEGRDEMQDLEVE